MGEITMNYEEKYNQALEWMRELYPTLQGMVKEDAEHYFPELRESEDERTRKAILHLVKSQKEQHFGIATYDDINWLDMIAWLEKQGEELDPRYSILDKLIEADTIYQMAMNDAMVEEAKSKAIASISKLSISELLGLEKQGEKPVEWSKKDEEYQDLAIQAIEYYFVESNPQRRNCINWLKSLKPQPRWKPLDEQMCAFKAVLDSYKMRVNDAVTNCAESLYNDLKSL